MAYVIEFMFYILIAISVTIPAGLYVAWSWSSEEVNFKTWIKNF